VSEHNLDAYFYNGIKSAIADVEEQQRWSKRRLTSLVQQNHPSAAGQRRWIELNDQWLAILRAEQQENTSA
jgi:hypothetical protein